MNLQQYRENKKKLSENNSSRRLLCSKCVQPQFSCYCNNIQKFDPKIKFVILIHPIEVRRRIATGRMSHLILENSELISGQNYSENSEVNKILNDENYYSVMHYPGRQST
ncbi:MAG: DTW domain-containing protein, partial [Pseudobdellovibrionaceae bacterium]